MPITVKACLHCQGQVKDAFKSSRIPYYENENGDTLTVYCSSPSDWPKTSLMATCWRAIRFDYHDAVHNGDTLSCERRSKGKSSGNGTPLRK
ncbi:uncharacterized protein B0T15DRAFT_530989 [Chaetomium strumarium]|uniref:Uncharacterized protein n=1 Tax=Chaetomium strumarium TaxID=1170767 RepID=A0AAJ0GX09_9PEZI|nr:hypothetical protein B0T15DRAFT_530989 [Chaetomium strumarium]